MGYTPLDEEEPFQQDTFEEEADTSGRGFTPIEEVGGREQQNRGFTPINEEEALLDTTGGDGAAGGVGGDVGGQAASGQGPEAGVGQRAKPDTARRRERQQAAVKGATDATSGLGTTEINIGGVQLASENINPAEQAFNAFAKRGLTEFGKAIKGVGNFVGQTDRAEQVSERLGIGGAGEADRRENKTAYQIGQFMVNSVQEAFPEDPEMQGSFLASKLPAAVGSGAAYIGAAAVSGGAGAAAMGSLSLAQQEFEQAKRKGSSDDEAFSAFLWNLPAGGIEAIPAARYFKRLDKFTGGQVKKVLSKGTKSLLQNKPAQTLIGGVDEAVQEIIQQTYSNIAAGKIYDKTRGIFEGVTEGGTLGFGAGILLNAMGLSLRGQYAKAQTKEARADIVEGYELLKQAGNDARMRDVVLDMEDLQAAELEQALRDRSDELNSIGREEAREPGMVMTLPNHEKDLAHWAIETKAVDDYGQPIPYYHGTDQTFGRFSKEKIGSEHDEGWYGAGFYWTPDPTNTEEFMADVELMQLTEEKAQEADTEIWQPEEPPQPNVRKAYLDLRDPLVVDRTINVPGSKALLDAFDRAISDPETRKDFEDAKMLLKKMRDRSLKDIDTGGKQATRVKNVDALNDVERKRWDELVEQYGKPLGTQSDFMNYISPHIGGKMATGFAKAAGKDGAVVYYHDNNNRTIGNANEVVVFDEKQIRNAYSPAQEKTTHTPLSDQAEIPDKYGSPLINAYEQYAFAKENREATSGVMDASESAYNEQAALHEQKLRELKQRARAEGVNPISFIRDMENRGYGTQAVAQLVAEEMAVQARQKQKARRVQEAHEVSTQQKTLMMTKPQLPSEAVEGTGTELATDAREKYVPEEERTMWRKFKNWFMGGSSYKETEPPAIRQEKQRTEGAMNAELKKMQLAAGKYLRALDEERGKASDEEVSQRERQLMEDTQAVLEGRKDLEDLPKSMREATMEMRVHVDRLSQQAINEGIASGPLEATFRQGLGIYLKRSYKIDDVEDWGRSNLDQQVLNEAAAYLQEENPDWSGERVQNEIDRILKQDRSSDYYLPGGEGDADFSSLRHRKTDEELDPRIRALMGEYTKGHINYMKSVANLAQMIHKSRFNQRVKEIGLEAGFIMDRAGDQRVPDHFEPVDLSNEQLDSPEQRRQNSTLAADPQVAQALEDLDNQYDPGLFVKSLLTMNAGAKYSKTVLAQITHGRNLIGGLGFALQNARKPKGKDFRWAYNVAVANARDKTDSRLLTGDPDPKQLEKDLLQMTKFGLLDQDTQIGEIRGLVEDIGEETSMENVMEQMISSRSNDNPVYKAARFLRLSGENASKVYQAEDNLIRLAFYKAEQRRFRKALPGWSDDRINAKAASNVKKTYQDYSQVPNWVKELRRVPPFGTFVSFHAEVFRTSINTASIGWQELNSPNRELKKIGAKRLAGLTASLIPLAGAEAGIAAAATKLMSDVTDEEDSWLRDFLAPWDKDSELAHVAREGLDFFYVNVSHLDPMSVIKEPVARAFRNGKEPPLDRLMGVARKLLGPFMDREIIATKLQEASQGMTTDGKPIWNRADSKATKAKKALWHVWEGFEPGAFRSARKMGYSYDVSVNQGIPDELQVGEELPKSQKEEWQAVLGAMGLRVTKVNVPRSLMFQGREYSKQIQSARSIFNKRAKYNENATPEEVSNAMKTANQAYREQYKEMRRKVQNARKLGMSWKEIDSKLDDAGVSKKYREDLKRGWARDLVGFEDMQKE